MRILVKDSANNVMVLNSLNGLIPNGYTIVPEEEIPQEELNLARSIKINQIRSQRNNLLLLNDKSWLIAKKTNISTTILEAEAETLRGLPEVAQTALGAMTTVEDIEAYDAFVGL